MAVRGLMKTPVTTVPPEDSLHVADGVMSLGGIPHLPANGRSVVRRAVARHGSSLPGRAR